MRQKQAKAACEAFVFSQKELNGNNIQKNIYGLFALVV